MLEVHYERDGVLIAKTRTMQRVRRRSPPSDCAEVPWTPITKSFFAFLCSCAAVSARDKMERPLQLTAEIAPATLAKAVADLLRLVTSRPRAWMNTLVGGDSIVWSEFAMPGKLPETAGYAIFAETHFKNWEISVYKEGSGGSHPITDPRELTQVALGLEKDAGWSASTLLVGGPTVARTEFANAQAWYRVSVRVKNDPLFSQEEVDSKYAFEAIRHEIDNSKERKPLYISTFRWGGYTRYFFKMLYGISTNVSEIVIRHLHPHLESVLIGIGALDTDFVASRERGRKDIDMFFRTRYFEQGISVIQRYWRHIPPFCGMLYGDCLALSRVRLGFAGSIIHDGCFDLLRERSKHPQDFDWLEALIMGNQEFPFNPDDRTWYPHIGPEYKRENSTVSGQ